MMESDDYVRSLRVTMIDNGRKLIFDWQMKEGGKIELQSIFGKESTCKNTWLLLNREDVAFAREIWL